MDFVCFIDKIVWFNGFLDIELIGHVFSQKRNDLYV